MEVYPHAKVIMRILVGFALSHLLGGLVRLIQHPKRVQVYWVHLVCVAFAFFYVISFWWWEFWLEKLPSWTFAHFLFVTLYCVLLYLLCAMLMPVDLTGYDGFRDYFYSRRQWFFGFMAAICVVDFIDSAIRGVQRLQLLGSEYNYIQAGSFVCSLVAMKTRSVRFHAAFAVISTLYQGFYHILLFLESD